MQQTLFPPSTFKANMIQYSHKMDRKFVSDTDSVCSEIKPMLDIYVTVCVWTQFCQYAQIFSFFFFL